MPGPTASVPIKRLLDIPGQNAEQAAFMSIAVALASELNLVRMRLDTLERVVDRAGINVREAIEAFEATPEEQRERDQLRMRSLDRVFRVFKRMGEERVASFENEAEMEQAK